MAVKFTLCLDLKAVFLSVRVVLRLTKYHLYALHRSYLGFSRSFGEVYLSEHGNFDSWRDDGRFMLAIFLLSALRLGVPRQIFIEKLPCWVRIGVGSEDFVNSWRLVSSFLRSNLE